MAPSQQVPSAAAGAAPAPAAQPTQTTTEVAPTPTPTNPYMHNIALVVTPIAAGSMFLPPRRLNINMVILGGLTLWGTNQLIQDYTGESFGQRFNRRWSTMGGGKSSSSFSELPEKAQRTQVLLRQEKLRREAAALAKLPEADRKRAEELLLQKHAAAAAEVEKNDRGTLEAIWMGDASKDWKKQREERERKALQDGGGGYWGLIMDQISDVWNQRPSKSADDAAKNEAETQKTEDQKKSS